MSTYKLIWDDFCSWYLEMIKPPYQQGISKEIHDQAVQFFDRILTIVHPFMPFISEEIWHHLPNRNGESITYNSWPGSSDIDEALLSNVEFNQ